MTSGLNGRALSNTSLVTTRFSGSPKKECSRGASLFWSQCGSRLVPCQKSKLDRLAGQSIGFQKSISVN